MLVRTVLCFFAVGLLLPDSAHAETGLDIMTRADKANAGFKDESSDSELILINAHGDRVVRKTAMRILEQSGDGDRSIITFLWPADVKGTKMLTWAHKTKNDDQWLYLPAFNKVKRISSRSRSGSFMGSEFAYEDLGSQEIEKFTYKLVKEEKVAGRDCWVIERVPTYKSGYSRQLVWMDKGYMNAVKIEYYDRKAELLKTSEISGYAKHGKFWRFAQIEIKNHQTQKRSILKISNRKVGMGVDASDFEKRALSD